MALTLKKAGRGEKKEEEWEAIRRLAARKWRGGMGIMVDTGEPLLERRNSRFIYNILFSVTGTPMTTTCDRLRAIHTVEVIILQSQNSFIPEVTYLA